jgi:hypothetical protein
MGIDEKLKRYEKIEFLGEGQVKQPSSFQIK